MRLRASLYAELLRAELWRTLGRHQLGAIAATAVDFGSMILLVSRLGVDPVPAAALGATVGGITNFTLGRTWIFRSHGAHWAAQAARYAFVSACGAGLNAAGEHLLHDLAAVHYLVARVATAIAVSLLWSFPMQRGFVFGRGGGR